MSWTKKTRDDPLKLHQLHSRKEGYEIKELLKDKGKCEFLRNYRQKLAYTIGDLEVVIERRKEATFADRVCLFLLPSWVLEGVETFIGAYLDDIVAGFEIDKDEDRRCKKYIQALRSFVAAHPLNTNRHKDFGFDGDLICMDISSSDDIVEMLLTCHGNEGVFVLARDGLKRQQAPADSLVLKVYSMIDDGGLSMKSIYVPIAELASVTNYLIDKINRFFHYVVRKNDEINR